MMIEIWYKGELLAKMPSALGTMIELSLDDGRLLHIGPHGMYFKQEVTPDDNIQVVVV